MKMKNPMNKLHIPEKMKLMRQSKLEKIKSVHSGFKDPVIRKIT